MARWPQADPLVLIRPALVVGRFVLQRIGLKWVIGAWVASTLGILVYEFANG